MTPERWRTVKELAAAASELTPGEQHSYIAGICADDIDLHREVVSLLEAAEQSPAFVERPAIESLAPELTRDAPQSLVGRQFGSYQIVRLIAVGGMGSVYLGRRADQEYQQEVAIKVIRGSFHDGESYRRFCQERQTLANLNHPNIARLLDGGRSDDGLPYLVMEYVAGQSIDAFCSERNLNLTGRLKLFREVCGAVHYAHQNLIVHRDLKPSNILVNAAGAPKLLDFGIATVIDAGGSPPSVFPTPTIQRCLTPDYASPEQIRGEPVTTASDVYSLGVLLYELLTGRLPFKAQSGLMHEIARTICEDEPLRPSTALRRMAARPTKSESTHPSITTDPAATISDEQTQMPWRRLAGDLDAIVMMAMRKEPRRRYDSVEQFSDDIHRHLEGQPIRARQNTWRYRSAKFTRRNWAAAIASAVMVVSLFGGIIVSVRSARIANRERDAAQQARQIAQQEADNARIETRKSEKVRSFLQGILAAANPNQSGPNVTVGALLDEAAERVVNEFGDDPEIESAVRSAIGDAYLGLGRYPEAEIQLRTALAIQRTIHNGDHADVAASCNMLGVLLHAKGEYAAAQTWIEQSLSMNRRLFGDEHSDVAKDLNNLGVMLRLQGDDVKAESMLRQALAIRRRVFGNKHMETAQSMNNLVAVMLNRREYAAAEPLCTEVLAIRRELLGNDHPLVAQAVHNLGVLLGRMGRIADADSLLRQSIELYREKLGPNHPDLAGGLYNLGELLLLAGEFETAEPLLNECLEIRRRSLPARDARILMALQSLGSCLMKLQKYEEAEPLIIEAYELQEESLGTKHSAAQAGLTNLIELYEAWGRPKDAARHRARLTQQTTTGPSARGIQ